MRSQNGSGGTRASRAALIDKRLRLQLGIFAIIYLIMTVLVSERLIRGDVDPLWAPAGFVAGLALGFVLSRTKVLGWDEAEGTVVGRSDALGIA
ncbi:MAG: hypothetical protein IT336_14870, partial [Thermomicrobiales bacterium]|nr:hypothetical protein [Thermomicrobiales bacterium]